MKSIIKILIALVVVLLVMTGCEYDVAEPQWTQEHEDPPVPVINQVDPSGAVAGVNTITIMGEYFSDTMEKNHVYFDNTEVEILESSSDMIKVRRPNIVNDSSTVTVVSYDALLAAKFGPYRVDSVMEPYGNFLENDALSALAMDEDENLYVVLTADPRKPHHYGQREYSAIFRHHPTTYYAPRSVVIGELFKA